jgi:hypothetical protein
MEHDLLLYLVILLHFLQWQQNLKSAHITRKKDTALLFGKV